jgi:hypothetical protein
MFLIAALRGPQKFNRFVLFYVVAMLFLFFCLIGGVPHIPSSPAYAPRSPYPEMPKPNPVPNNAADELRKRINSYPKATR